MIQSAHPLVFRVAEGLSLDLKYPLQRRTLAGLRRSTRMVAGLPPALAGAGRRGQGIRCGRLLRRGIPDDVRAVESLASGVPESLQVDFWFGVGWGLGESDAPVAGAADCAARVPESFRSAALEGYGAVLRHRHGAQRATTVVGAISASLARQDADALRSGSAWPGYPH